MIKDIYPFGIIDLLKISTQPPASKMSIVLGKLLFEYFLINNFCNDAVKIWQHGAILISPINSFHFWHLWDEIDYKELQGSGEI
jgi:hypothetical protein